MATQGWQDHPRIQPVLQVREIPGWVYLRCAVESLELTAIRALTLCASTLLSTAGPTWPRKETVIWGQAADVNGIGRVTVELSSSELPAGVTGVARALSSRCRRCR